MSNYEKLGLMNGGMLLLAAGFIIFFVVSCIYEGTTAPAAAMWTLVLLMLLHWRKQHFRTKCMLHRMKNLATVSAKELRTYRKVVRTLNFYGLGIVSGTICFSLMVVPGDEPAEANMMAFAFIGVIFYTFYRKAIVDVTRSLRKICRREMLP